MVALGVEVQDEFKQFSILDVNGWFGFEFLDLTFQFFNLQHLSYTFDLYYRLTTSFGSNSKLSKIPSRFKFTLEVSNYLYDNNQSARQLNHINQFYYLYFNMQLVILFPFFI